MTHEKILRDIKANLTKLKKTQPSTYAMVESELLDISMKLKKFNKPSKSSIKELGGL